MLKIIITNQRLQIKASKLNLRRKCYKRKFTTLFFILLLLAMQIGPTWEKQWPRWIWRRGSILIWSLLEIIWGWHCHLQRWGRLSSRFRRGPCQIHIFHHNYCPIT